MRKGAQYYRDKADCRRLARAQSDTVWATRVAFSIGNTEVAQDLRGWVNSGLMTFFFLVVGLEARREFDLGELRERRRLALPFASGVGGMIVPISIFGSICCAVWDTRSRESESSVRRSNMHNRMHAMRSS